jgi:hypothetical protein
MVRLSNVISTAVAKKTHHLGRSRKKHVISTGVAQLHRAA